MPQSGAKTTNKYSQRFKATAVRLSRLPGVAVQDVAESLYIHPFMLSRWRKEVREGKIVAKKPLLDEQTSAELKALRKATCRRYLMNHKLTKSYQFHREKIPPFGHPTGKSLRACRRLMHSVGRSN
jgi:transposase